MHIYVKVSSTMMIYVYLFHSKPWSSHWSFSIVDPLRTEDRFHLRAEWHNHVNQTDPAREGRYWDPHDQTHFRRKAALRRVQDFRLQPWSRSNDSYGSAAQRRKLNVEHVMNELQGTQRTSKPEMRTRICKTLMEEVQNFEERWITSRWKAIDTEKQKYQLHNNSLTL